MNLSEFLLARIAEDEAVARATSGQPWSADVPRMVHADAGFRIKSRYVASVERDEDRAHMARWDPARVLTECESKRRIVERFAKPGGPMDDSDFADGWATGEEWTRDFLLQTLALPYADHPAYDESWRP